MPETATLTEPEAPARPAPYTARAFAETRPLGFTEMLNADLRWPRPSLLAAPLKSPSPKAAEALAALGLHTLGDLIEHLPRDRREARTISTLRAGEQATVAVEVVSITMRSVRRRGMRPLVEANVRDESGSMRVTFFNQPWLVQRYAPPTRLLLHGKAGAGGRFSVSHHAPGSQIGAQPPGVADAGGEGLVAHYPAREGITSTQILTLVNSSREALGELVECLPANLRAAEKIPERAAALTALHFPRDSEDPSQGRERLAFEELLLCQLAFLRRRERRRSSTDAHVFDEPPSLCARWLKEGLPFALTADQHTAVQAIESDLARARPMQRLLMGEVGSGKTVVALYGMLRAVEHGHQAALMAPTETLSEQHFQTLQKLIGAEGLSCALLTGSTPQRRRRDILSKLASGECSLIVGTHALIEPDVRFRSLAFAVIDEQHRFGVRQRAALDEKGSPLRGDSLKTPHVLHMTATPIPRTLALAGYGDLDVSTLRELPRGRQEIITRIVDGDEPRERAYVRLREELDSGRQAYVICPLVESGAAPLQDPADGGASSDLRAATEEFARLAEGELSGHRLVLLHGQMRSAQKQRAMAEFAEGRADVLVATTVVEVGIDVPNATMMLVENAERFGISQLHQLRGRIGRGEHRSMCLLMGAPTSSRLRALAKYSDGFKLAEIDLALRKEGELIGTRQSGLGQFLVASLPTDAELLERARIRAQEIIALDSELSSPEHLLLAGALREAFGEKTHEPIQA
jgi:ATP-dependent DNA helicase RecG